MAGDQREGGGAAGAGGGKGEAEVGTLFAGQQRLGVGGEKPAGIRRQGGGREPAVRGVADQPEDGGVPGRQLPGCGEEFHAVAAAAFELDGFEAVDPGGEEAAAEVVLGAVVGVVDHQVGPVDPDAAAIVGVQSEGVEAGNGDLDEARGADGVVVAGPGRRHRVVSKAAVGSFAEVVDDVRDDRGFGQDPRVARGQGEQGIHFGQAAVQGAVLENVSHGDARDRQSVAEAAGAGRPGAVGEAGLIPGGRRVGGAGGGDVAGGRAGCQQHGAVKAGAVGLVGFQGRVLRRKVLLHRHAVRLDQREVFTTGGQREIRVQRLVREAPVLAGCPDDAEFAGGQRDVRKSPL